MLLTATNTTPPDPATVNALGRAVFLLAGFAAFTLILIFGLLFVVARRRNRRRAAARAANRPIDPRDPWTESARRMPTPPDESGPDTPMDADPNEDTTPWDAPLPPYTNGSPSDPNPEDDPEGPYQ